MRKVLVGILALLVVAFATTINVRPAQGYIEIALTLGKVVGDSTNIVLMQVESVDKVKHTITYKKVEDIKGKHPTDIIKHNVAEAGFSPREWQTVMAWAEPGQMAVMFHNVTASETCINNYWYQCYPGGEWWNMFHGEPYLLRSYAGKPEKLVPLVKQILQGQEVVITAMIDGDKNALHTRTARVQRLKASLKIQDYDAKRDFVGWGGDELKTIAMAGFTHYSPFTRTSFGGGRGGEGTLTMDFDGDGKPDFLLYGESRASLYLGDGTSTNEVLLPLPAGARGAAMGRLRNDKYLDLVFATASGPKLISNLGSGTVRDDSAAIPRQSYTNTTAVAVLDYDNDGKPDILVADGFTGLHLYRNLTPRDSVREAVPKFEEVSDKVGFGGSGLGAGVKGSTLLVADVNGDGRQDVVFVADAPMVLINTEKGFVSAGDSMLNFVGGGQPTFGVIDGVLHLAVGGAGKVQLYRCDGKGHFAAVSGLPTFAGEATSVAIGDFTGAGKMDLLVGVVRGPNRYLRNVGGGKFEDATEKVGLSQKIFNTRAIAMIDLNKDGTQDLILNNDGQESVLLLGNPARKGEK